MKRVSGLILPMALLAIVWSGCRSLGPEEITGTHNAYSEAIINSMDNQMLQNLVRLRYRDNPSFLAINSVTASMRLETRVTASARIVPNSDSDFLSPLGDVKYTAGPTISYAPLRGEEFLKNILTPIPLETLFVLIQSGWSAERVFGICVERINDLENAPRASGPTPSSPPRNQVPFLQLLSLLETIRKNGSLFSKVDSETGELYVLFDPSKIESPSSVIVEFLNLLDLDPTVEQYRVDGEVFQEDRISISIRTRSILSMLFYLSQNIDVPEQHKAEGLVTVTRSANGSEYDWSNSAAGARFHIQVSESQPDNAIIAIPYRDYWFYLDESDLDSKSSFMLLSQLFSLQGGSAQRPGPTLTIPVSQ